MFKLSVLDPETLIMRFIKKIFFLTLLVGLCNPMVTLAQNESSDIEVIDMEQAAVDAATEAATETEMTDAEEITNSESLDINSAETSEVLETAETTDNIENIEEAPSENTPSVLVGDEENKKTSPAADSLSASNINTDLSLTEIILDSEEDRYDFYAQQNQTIQNNQRQKDLYHLQKAKFKLINGDLLQAEFFLNRIDDKKSIVLNIKKRYMAIIYFLRNQFTQSIGMLNHPTLKIATYNSEICLLRMMNYIALNDIENLKIESRLCQIQTMKYSKNDQQWLENLLDVKMSKDIGVGKNLTKNVELVFLNEDVSRLWLKTGLFLNKESEFIKLISKLPASSYQSRQLREIIAFMYFRLKQYDKAMSFIDDIDSANAENIKGNIRLVNKEYELAFGHFKLALQKKSDSPNSLERAVPLSWLLGQWDDGLSMLNNMINSKVDQKNKDALRIAFLIRKNDLKTAQKELMILKRKFDNKPPFEVNIMESFVNLILEKDVPRQDLLAEKRKTEESIENSCRAFDGISCWLAMQYLEYDNLSKTLDRTDPVTMENTLSLDDLKKPATIKPLDEESLVDQSDVEELDGKQIKINP